MSYEFSRRVFDHTCKSSPPDAFLAPGGERAWLDLQAKLSRWEVLEYGYQPSERNVLGLAEEYAEYLEAGSPEKKRDGIADMSIYLIKHVNGHRLDAGVLINSHEIFESKSPPVWIGRLSHVELKYLQGIRGMTDRHGFMNREVVRRAVAVNAAGLFRWLQEKSKPYLTTTFTYKDLVAEVAEQVMCREKKLLPQTIGIAERAL